MARKVRIQLSAEEYELLFSDKFGSHGDTADERLSRALDLAEEFCLQCGETCCDPDVGQCDCICHPFFRNRLPR